MLHFKMSDGTLNGDLTAILAHDPGVWNDRHTLSRSDFKTFVVAETMATKANALNDGNRYVATDAGEHCWPRYDVQRAPKVGDEVSYSFNGDSYPCGKIVSVGKGAKMVVRTSTGEVFYRRKLTGSWVMKGGTWCLVQGHINERNPHF